jgi:hypothetical protein
MDGSNSEDRLDEEARMAIMHQHEVQVRSAFQGGQQEDDDHGVEGFSTADPAQLKVHHAYMGNPALILNRNQSSYGCSKLSLHPG